jgi:CHAD domain-containing protein
MAQQCLLNYYTTRCQQLQKHFAQAAIYFDVESIHDLRVEIKRLRAFFQLIEWVTPEFKAKKNLRTFRKLFKSAADLRDIHVQQLLTRTWSQAFGVFLSEYYNTLKSKEFPARAEFAAFASHCGLQQEIEKNEKRLKHALAPLTDAQISIKIYDRITYLLQHILSYGKDGHEDKNLHNVRILTKETRYITEIASHCFPDPTYDEAFIQQLKGIHQTLGDWHDIQVAYSHLEDFEEEYGAPAAAPPFTTQEVYDRLHAMLRKQQQTLRHQFDGRWEEFIGYITTHFPALFEDKSLT